MIRLVLLAALLFATPSLVRGQTVQQSVVDRSTLTVQGMMGAREGRDARQLMARARGVLVCPQVFQAGFIIGGKGGNCVLSGRLARGWSAPSFYDLASGSIGLQAGIQDSEVLLIVLTDKGLQALIDDQFQIGGDAGVSFATYGTGISGGLTTALKADVVAFSRSRGLFAGLTLDGSVLSVRSGWNATYYGKPIAAQQLVIQGEGSNPGAAPLQEMLLKFQQPG